MNAHRFTHSSWLSMFILLLSLSTSFSGGVGSDPNTDPFVVQHLIHIGGGLNLSSTDRSENAELDVMSVKGFNLGIDYEYILFRNLSLMPGISLETRGEHTLDNRTIEEKDGFKRFYCLQAPLFAKVNIPFFFDENRISLFGGPEAGLFLLRTAEVGGVEVDGDQLRDMKIFDLGFSAGMSLELGAGSGAFVFSGSLYRGLFDNVPDIAGAPAAESQAAKHRNIKLKGAYVFRLW